MQYCGLSAAAAALDADAFCHVRSADLCGLNPTTRPKAPPSTPIGALMGIKRCTRPMSEVRNLPGRAATPGKRTSPWKERIVLITCIVGVWQIGDEVIGALDPHIGWWAKPAAVIGLGLLALIVANQLILFIEKLQGVR